MAYPPANFTSIFDVNTPASNTAAVITYPNPLNDTQTLSITGSPTGGNFVVSFGGQSATIAYNASASSIQTSLQGLSSIGSGNILCYGGNLPTNPVVMVFSGALAGLAESLITISSTAFTGGTNPAASIVHTLVGGSSNYAHCISGIAWSYNIAPTGGNLQIADGNIVIFNMDITSAGAGFIPFNPAKESTVGNPLVITLAAGGNGCTGKVNVTGHWIRPL